jgi:ribonuclease VapC
MVLDTSAILAIIFNEEEADLFSSKITAAESRFVSAATLLETAIVLRNRTLSRDDRYIADFLAAVPVVVYPFDANQSVIARAAYLRFGRASGHPARLNFGDCFSYALAVHLGAPLLFKGNDFSHTEVAHA